MWKVQGTHEPRYRYGTSSWRIDSCWLLWNEWIVQDDISASQRIVLVEESYLNELKNKAFDLESSLDSDDEGDLDMVENNGIPITGVE